MAQEQLALSWDLAAELLAEPETPDHRSATSQQRAKRSIDYMLQMAFEYGGVDSVPELLDAVAGLYQYAPFNALLVLLQRPHATYLLPPQEWAERYVRAVKPGEQPIVLLQRGGPVMFLFDVSQSEPMAGSLSLPPALANPYAMADMREAEHALAWLVDNAKLDGVRVSSARHGLRSAGCISRSVSGVAQRATISRRPPGEADVPVRYEVLLNSAYSPTEQLATLAHELGHLFCGHVGKDPGDWWPDRRGMSLPQQEFEAESVARVVFRRLTPVEVELPPHLHQYFAPGQPLPTRGVQESLTAAGRVLEMTQGFTRRRPS